MKDDELRGTGQGAEGHMSKSMWIKSRREKTYVWIPDNHFLDG